MSFYHLSLTSLALGSNPAGGYLWHILAAFPDITLAVKIIINIPSVTCIESVVCVRDLYFCYTSTHRNIDAVESLLASGANFALLDHEGK